MNVNNSARNAGTIARTGTFSAESICIGISTGTDNQILCSHDNSIPLRCDFPIDLGMNCGDYL